MKDFIDRNDIAYKRLIETNKDKGIDRPSQYHPLLVSSQWFGVCKVCAAAIPVSVDKDNTLEIHAARHVRPPKET